MLFSIKSFETGSTHNKNSTSLTDEFSAKNMPCIYVVLIL